MGPAGPTGPAGATGPSGTATLVFVTASATDTAFNNNEELTATATCSGATPRVIGGGVQTSSNQKFQVANSWPSAADAWTATIVSFGSAGSVTMTTYAICVP
ncbi:MAG: hypothetical protein AAB131_07125 [Actinomycetota bacterium]|jgi:hypothetical protein